VKYNQFVLSADQTFGVKDAAGVPQARFSEIPVESLHPLVLAYIGDAWFSLYVRCNLLRFEQSKVRVLHGHGARMVSATLQAYALRKIEAELTDAEKELIRRGRNAKSTVPKSASVADYRYSTGFEALLGYLHLTGQDNRLREIAGRAFAVISRKLSEPKENENDGENG
jgi:ribonuclease-3 family protein